MKRPSKKFRALAFALGAACCVIALLAWLDREHADAVVFLDNEVHDFMMRRLDAAAPSPAVAIVDIDERSLAALGQWPWPRDLLADLVGKILADGAAAVGLDILLSEPDRTSPARFAEELEKRTGRALDLSAYAPEAVDHDLRFREAIKGRPVALGAFGYYAGAEAWPDPMPSGAMYAEKKPKGMAHLPDIREGLTPLSSLAAPLPFYGATVGLFNTHVDSDGTARAVPVLVKAGDKVFTSLALATLQKAVRKPLFLMRSPHDTMELRLGPYTFPIQADGSYRPVFRGPGHTFPYYSAEAVLSRAVPAEALAGRIVFVGSTAAGLRDFRKTPFDEVMPGVEIHATVVDNVLAGTGMLMPAGAARIILCAVALGALVCAVLFTLATPPVYCLGGVVLLALWWGGAWVLFRHGIFLSPVLPTLAVLLMAMLCLPVRQFVRDRQAAVLKRAFNRYVAPEVVARVVEQGGRPLAGAQKEVTVLFTDVRNFTAISEKLAPAQLVELLNAYFTPMTACVISREGTLDKFIGDALMAFWNAPVQVENHQRKAVEAALEMQATLARLRPQFQERFGVELRIGCGINSGRAHVGNMGSNDLLDYTCIGDNVNLASRLEGLCRVYGCDIIVSGAVAEACGPGIFFRPLDRVRVKGKQQAVEIFVPVPGPVDNAREECWREALGRYFAGDFGEAEKQFAQLAEYADMRVAALLFAGRARRLALEPPENWDGTWVYSGK